MNLKELALDTVRITQAGGYGDVSFRDELAQAIAATALFRPGEEQALAVTPAPSPTRIEVTGESTLGAARRLIAEGRSDTVALNFASAKNVGGGWLGGARAQEEFLCRASVLAPCLESKPEYYAANRANRSALYTDHLIYSPKVPVFRDDDAQLLPRPYLCGFITSPAPNTGALEQNSPELLPQLRPTFERRIRQVLRVAAARGHRTLVLGAWGCGAFHGDPELVAVLFRDALKEPPYATAFERIVFAILGGAGKPNFDVFARVFSDAATTR